LPAASRGVTVSLYRPSITRRPSLVRPSHVVDVRPLFADLVYRATTVPSFRVTAVSSHAASDSVWYSRSCSRTPSRFGDTYRPSPRTL
jgi:hypothetical protein